MGGAKGDAKVDSFLYRDAQTVATEFKRRIKVRGTKNEWKQDEITEGGGMPEEFWGT